MFSQTDLNSVQFPIAWKQFIYLFYSEELVYKYMRTGVGKSNDFNRMVSLHLLVYLWAVC